MISLKSIKNFILINSTLFIFSHLQFEYHSLIFVILRNLFFVWIIDYLTSNNPSLSSSISTKYNYFELYSHLIVCSVMEYFTVYYFYDHMKDGEIISLNSYLLFLAISFPFELTFDFFHYWSHRICHHRLLYKYLHKTHHKYTNIISIIAFYESPVDLILTNIIPFYLTNRIFNLVDIKFNYFIICLLLNYKIYIEIAGHCGRDTNSSSFPQFIWLPKLLNIHLITKDHDLHHKNSNCNFSKRFKMWDRVFGTYVSSEK